MKALIDVHSRQERQLVSLALEHRETRALMNVMGALMLLPSDRARISTMRYVQTLFDEMDLASLAETTLEETVKRPDIAAVAESI